jgi:hypothetical protein
MKKLITVCAVIGLMFAIASAVQADFVPNPSTDVSYGIWFDRDGGQGSAKVGNQIVSDGTPGIYDIEVTYHAVDADTATMFATVNGIQQGFYINGVDYTPAGKSFDSSSLNAMQIFYWSRFPVWKAGDIGLLNISATGDLGTNTYSDLVWTKDGIGPTSYPTQFGYGEFGDVWDLTEQDLILSYTVDFQDVWGNATTYATLMFEFGLRPDGWDPGIGANPVGGGWMGSVQVDLTTSPGAWYMNDKFDLQKTGTDAEWSYNVVPVPGAVLLGMLGFGVAGLKLRKSK